MTPVAQTSRRCGPVRRACTLVVLTLLAFTSVGPLTTAASAGAKTGTLDFATEDSVARADNGDTVLTSGEGTFGLQPKSIEAEGSFTHRSSSGNVLAQGTWQATTVLSFRSFGPATAVQQSEFGLPPGSEGGQLKFKVALFVNGAHVHDGIITITCLLGTPPRNAVESTLVLVQDTPYNFNQPVSGDNIFIRR